METSYLAHIAEDGREQSVYEHLTGTAELCGKFASSFQAEDQGRYIGLMHDIGKYSEKFQYRLHGGPKTDHSTAGAYESKKNKKMLASFCIAGHHSGLPDGGGRGDIAGNTLWARLRRAEENKLPDYSAWSEKVQLECHDLPADNPELIKDPVTAGFYVRMLFSCLTDADFLDTEAFMYNEKRTILYDDLSALFARLEEYITPWFPPKGELNQKRCTILENCLEKAEYEKGLYTLTVPTGGGKTVASLAFALKHADRHNMQRVIYVIPYTSIIEQNAKVFRTILGDENVLECHSSVEYDIGDEATPEQMKKLLATENWEAPVVVTTAVQFFESLFSNKSSKCRKLHNIANSVVIFDEAQMLPLPYLKPCVFAISELVSHYNVTAVLCTATQPALDRFFSQYLPEFKSVEICPSEIYGDSVFKRVTFEYLGKIEMESLCKQLNMYDQILCIVNSRKEAQEIYEKLNKEGAYHLSTLMCPSHRTRQFTEIRKRLELGMPCRVISTSLIEAGVDVDFPVVYREEAGLDSILQAAGRCNREGRRKAYESTVRIFQSEMKIPPLFQPAVAAGRVAMQDSEDIAGRETVSKYFEELYDAKGNDGLDCKQIMRKLKEDNFPFETVAKEFKLIETDTQMIYIPYENGVNLISRLRAGEYSKALYRQLAQYGVSIYKEHYESLVNAGAIQLLEDGSAYLTDEMLYDDQTGLSLKADSGQAIFI